jgi:RNA polymerase sigma-70 factor (ECF subfamily)
MKPSTTEASSMFPTEGLAPAALLEHAQSLRALAIALLRNADAADDAVQDTWVRALERPPRNLERIGGWLRTVLVSVVANQKRGERRREAREQLCARSETSLDTRERERSLRALVAAVTELDEPYKTVVLLRYFEALPPREIAERLQVPPTVVYNRLHRAHALLRAKLEREDRAWMAALAAFVGRNAALQPLAASSASAGSVSVAWGYAAVGAVAATALVVFAWRPETTSGEPSSPRTETLAASTPFDASGANSDDESSDEGGAARAAVALPEVAAKAALVQTSMPFAFEIELSVTDSDDAPVVGAQVFVAPQRQPLDCAGSTDFDGKLVVRWRDRVDALDVVVGASTGSASADLQLVRVAAGTPRRVALRPRTDPRIVSMLDMADVAHRIEEEDVRAARLAELMDTSVGVEVGETFAMLDRGHGEVGFVDPWMVTVHADEGKRPRIAEELALAYDRLRGLGYVATEEYAVVTAIGVAKGSAASAYFALSGTLNDAGGALVPHALVRARPVSGRGVCSTRSDANGAFELPRLPVGECEIVAGDGGHGIARTTLVGAANEKLSWHAQLDRGRELRGRLVDARGEPLARWSVEVESSDPWVDGELTANDGSFVIPSLPATSLRVLARPTHGCVSLPLLVAESAWASSEVQVFRAAIAADAAPGWIELELVDEHGNAVNEAQMRVWNVELARGVSTTRDGDDGRFAIAGLPPGDYRVEFGAPAHAWTTLEHVSVRAGEGVRLGSLQLPQPARVELRDSDPPSGHAAMTFVRQLAGQPTAACVVKSLLPCTIELPAGDYELAFEGHDAQRLTVAAGQPLELVAPRPPATADEGAQRR